MSFEVSKNILHYYTDLLRLEDGEQRTVGQGQQYVTGLQNVIRAMCQSRRNRLCGEDFTRLDLGNIALNGIYFSLEGKYPSRFDGSRLNEWNFIGGHRAGISAVAWSPDGRYILTCSYDNTAILWDADSGLMVRKLTGHTKGVTSVAFSPDGERIITGSMDCKPIIWETNTGAIVKRLEGHVAPVTSVAALPDGSCITLDINNTLIKWDIYSGERLIISSTVNTPRLFGMLSPCGRYCVSRNNSVKIYQTDSWTLLKICDWNTDTITCMCFSADSRYIALGHSNSTAVIYDIRECKEILTLTAPPICGSVTAVAISPDASTVFTGYANKEERVWSIKGECLAELTKHDDIVKAAAFSPDGKYLCTGSEDCCAEVLDTGRWKVWNLLGGFYASISSLILSDNGRYCLTWLYDETVKVWDIENRKLARIIDGHEEQIISVPSYQKERYYLTKNRNRKKIRDIKTGECVRTFEIFNEMDDVSAFLPNGRHFMTSLENGMTGIFDIVTGECIKTLKMPRQYGKISFDLHPEGRYFIYYDCFFSFIELWDLFTGKSIKRQNVPETDIGALAYSADGHYCTIITGKDTVSVWEAEDLRRIVTYRFSDILYAQLIGNYLYGITEGEFFSSKFSVFRVDVTDFYDIGEPETLATFYNADRLHIKNCSFKNITADDTARDIIYQYGGDTEKPISKSSAP